MRMKISKRNKEVVMTGKSYLWVIGVALIATMLGFSNQAQAGWWGGWWGQPEVPPPGELEEGLVHLDLDMNICEEPPHYGHWWHWGWHSWWGCRSY